MESSSKRARETDPDYELSDSTIKRIKIKEDQEKQELLHKVTNIITNHFNADLINRQSQIETIQERIVKARKTMHLLRYVLVKSYYNKKNCLLNDETSAPHPATCSEIVIDPQSRIHPAVKRLIGRNASFHFSGGRRRRKRIEEPSDNETRDDSDHNGCETKLTDAVVEGNNSNTENNNNNNNNGCDGVRNRKKRKCRVIIGNISKYMPASNPEDISTHKWMVYVRGPKEAPDVAPIIKRVVFYLHPSYWPRDVIELENPPFHLSRRGWGEFPVRVKMFFQCALNKPVDVIHNLKLDKTHTGQQTLGSETVIDFYLYEEDDAETNTTTTTEVATEKSDATVKQEPEEEVVVVKSEPVTVNFPSEHDYYTSDTDLPVEVDVKIDTIQLDHTYCLPESAEKREEMINGNAPLNNNNNTTTIKQLIPQLLSKDTHVKVLKITDREGKAVIVSRNELLLDHNKYKINIPGEQQFKCVLEVLPFLLRRLPLVTNLADTVSYKCRYPYVARTLNEHLSWNIGRRRSSEWRRAKTVLEYLQSARISGYERWTTKLLVLYARAHAYTPSATYTLFENIPCTSLLTDYSVQNRLKNRALLPEPNVSINVTDDVENEEAPQFKLGNKSCLSSSKGSLECSFIRRVAANSRVQLQPEEIAPGVLCNAAEIMIWESLKCFVNDLLRNARTHCVLRGNFCEESGVIAAQDVTAAIHDRREFQTVFESFSNKSDMEYYM